VIYRHKNYEHLKQSLPSLPVDYASFVADHPGTQQIYHTVVSQIRDQRSTERSKIPGYLGSGREKSAFLVDGEYVVKFSNGARTNGELDQSEYLDNQINPLLKCINVPGLEQIITADTRTGVIVTKKAAGKPIVKTPMSELLGKIKPHHIAKLDTALQHLVDNNLMWENVENIFFDPEEGFTIIDYRLAWKTLDDEGIKENDHKDHIKRHEVQEFLDIVLSMRQREKKQFRNQYGEWDTYNKRTLGRRATATLVKRSIRQ
jgi:hypothetical protein